MLKKEFKEALRRALNILSFLSIIPLLWLLDLIVLKTGMDYFPFLILGVGAAAFFITAALSFSLFESEHTDHAFEYLLSLPLQKGRMLLYKVLPRFIIILIITGIYEILILNNMDTLELFRQRIALHPAFFPILMISLSFYGFITSLFGKINFVAMFTSSISFFSMFVVSMGIASIFVNINERPDPVTYSLFSLIGLLLSGTVVALLVFPIYRDFDLKPVGLHSRRYLARVLPVSLIMSLASVIIIVMNN